MLELAATQPLCLPLTPPRLWRSKHGGLNHQHQDSTFRARGQNRGIGNSHWAFITHLGGKSIVYSQLLHRRIPPKPPRDLSCNLALAAPLRMASSRSPLTGRAINSPCSYCNASTSKRPSATCTNHQSPSLHWRSRCSLLQSQPFGVCTYPSLLLHRLADFSCKSPAHSV